MKTLEPILIRASGGQAVQARLAIGPPVEIVEAAAAAEGEAPKRPRFSMVAYTGAPIQVGGFYTPLIIDLGGFRSASQEIPILFGHDADRIVGQTDEIKFGADGVTLTGRVTGDNEHAREVTSQAKNGFKWRASVGASIQRREFLEAGKKATVNGREVSGPMVIARETELLEVSFVPIGADNATSASVAASKSLGSPSGDASMGFDEWLKAKGFDPATLSDPQKAALRAAYDAEETVKASNAAAVAAAAASGTQQTGHAPPPGSPPQTYEQMVAERRADVERQTLIAQIGNRWMDMRPGQIDHIDHLTKLAMASKATTPEAFELTMHRDMMAGGFAVHSGVSDRESETSSKTIEAAVAQSLRLPDVEKHYEARNLELADRRWRSNIGLKELLQVVAQANGHQRVSTSDLPNLLRAACTRAGMVHANAGFSTLDISTILSNVGNKMVLIAFEGVESGWREIATVSRLNDFKSHTMLALTGDLQYQKVGAGGEIPHGTLGEQSYTLQADIYGKQLAITEQDLVNDDLGALDRVTFRLGRGGALVINDVFWTAFLANRDTFWAVGNNNVQTGGGTVLQSSSLKTALQTFRKQTDPDGKPLAITPKILLVPPELEITADELMTSTGVNTGGSSSTDKVPSRNVWSSKFQVVMSSYLSNTAYTGYSTTQWFLLADPRDLPTIGIGFLYGQQVPRIESAQADFDTLGIRFRGTHRFGVNKQEKRASVRMAGA